MIVGFFFGIYCWKCGRPLHYRGWYEEKAYCPYCDLEDGKWKTK